MNKLEICYDLYSPGQKYPQVEARIKELAADWVKIQRTTWLIATSHTASQVRDHIWEAMDSNDELLVSGLNGVAAWAGYDTEISNAIRRILNAA